MKVDGIGGNETLNRIRVLNSEEKSEKKVKAITSELKKIFPKDDVANIV